VGGGSPAESGGAADASGLAVADGDAEGGGGGADAFAAGADAPAGAALEAGALVPISTASVEPHAARKATSTKSAELGRERAWRPRAACSSSITAATLSREAW